MSEAEAYPRIAAARLGRRFPLVIELLAEGAVHLTAIRLLGPHLTEENHAQVLERARGKATREIEQLVAELAPKLDVPSSIRKLPAPVSARAGSSRAVPQREANATSAPLFARSPQCMSVMELTDPFCDERRNDPCRLCESTGCRLTAPKPRRQL